MAETFLDHADGDEPLRQRLVALAIAEAEYDANPDDLRRWEAVASLRIAVSDYCEVRELATNAPAFAIENRPSLSSIL